MTIIRMHRTSSRRRAVLALAAVALVVTGCNPFAPATPAPQGHSGPGLAAAARTAVR